MNDPVDDAFVAVFDEIKRELIESELHTEEGRDAVIEAVRMLKTVDRAKRLLARKLFERNQ